MVQGLRNRGYFFFLVFLMFLMLSVCMCRVSACVWISRLVIIGYFG